jgi:hypothetical protein
MTTLIAPGNDLMTTRWHYPSYLYLLFWGKTMLPEFEENMDYAVKRRFNSVRVNVWWHEIFPDEAAIRNGGSWAPLDDVVRCAIDRKLKVILTACIRSSEDNRHLFYTDADCVVDENGVPDPTRISFASPAIGRAIGFFQQLCARYVKEQNAGHILAVSPLTTREAEFPYAHESLEDFNPMFLNEFRSWLSGRYGTLSDLNAAWGTTHGSFTDVIPTRPLSSPAGIDFSLFRDLKAAQFVDSCGDSLDSIPGLTQPFRMILDYGNLGDTMFLFRGSMGFTLHGRHPRVWGWKQNDAHDYNQAYTGSLLGSHAARLGKAGFNEWFYYNDASQYPNQEVVGDSVREIKSHFDQGMNGVSYLGAYPRHAQDVDVVVKRLQDEGVWDAPVLKRTMDPESTVHMKSSEIMKLWDWKIRETYFDPHWKPSQPHLNLILERDLESAPLPVIEPVGV